MRGRLLSLLLVALAGVLAARADLAATCERAASASTPAPVVARDDGSATAVLPEYSFGDAPWSQSVLPAQELPPPLDAPSVASEVRTLPPAPDSAALCLSALAGFGVWQLGRSARKIHFGALPAWYHTDVVQVGHATPLDLEFSLAALPACVFDAPVVASKPACLSERLRAEPYKRRLSQTILLSADPRGPPLCSFTC